MPTTTNQPRPRRKPQTPKRSRWVSSMRLLSVIHGPAFGGAHNQARVLDDPLRDRGIETLVVLPLEARHAAERLRDAGTECMTMPLHRLRATTDLRIHGRALRSLGREVSSLADLVRGRAIDVVQVHGATNPHGALAARVGGAALVWQLFDTRAPMTLRRLAMPWVTRQADAMTTWGAELARVHPGAERLGDRLITVYPPVEQKRFAPNGERRAAARTRLGIDDASILIGTVGVLNPQKGHEYLIRAADRIRRSRPDSRFCILGGSSPAHADYERALRSEVSERGMEGTFQFVDPGGDVDLLLQAFDLFVMTSVPRSEGMPTAILEAMACAKPVAATRVGAVHELVDDGVTGFVVEPERPEELATTVLDLLGDPMRMAEVGKKGRERAAEAFGIERLADLHAGAYAAALSHHATRSR